MDADVAVIGVGTMGSMAMWQLAQKGATVIGFEQFGIGHDRSAAGGETRVFRTAYIEGAEYVPILQDAYRYWLELEKETGNSLIKLTGGITIGDPNADFMKGLLKSIKSFNLEHEIINEEEAKARFPQHRLLQGEIMILDKKAGYLRPELSIVSAVQLAEKLGAIVHKYTHVEKIKPDRNGVTIHTSGEEYRVGKVLISAGPWMKEFLPEIKRHLTINRLVMTWFPTNNVRLFKADQFPVFKRISNGIGIYGVPTVDDSMIKVGLNLNYSNVKNANNLNRTVDPSEIITVSKAVRDFLPGLYPDPVRANVYMDVYTPDKHPIVGQLPNYPNTFVMGGFSGHGFKMAPVMGKIAADLLLNGETSYRVNQFAPTRLAK